MSLVQAIECRNEFGRHLLMERPLEQIWPGIGERAEEWRIATSKDSPVCPGAISFQEAFPQQTVFLDLETCGFAGTPIFLIGIIQSAKGLSQESSVPSPPSSGERVRVRGSSPLATGLVLRQIWARHYGEEAAALATFCQMVGSARSLVSFNGKSFDWPQVRDRGLIHRVAFDAAETRLCHWDILPSARRRWKARVPNCRLQTLESYICGRRRCEDLPGHRVPQVYHDYVRTGDDAEIGGILRHNQWDLLTLLELAIRLAPATR